MFGRFPSRVNISASCFIACADEEEKNTPTPHDAIFRQFLTQPEVARDFMEIHLLATLKLEFGSFVEDDLRQYFSDVLYSLKTTAGDGYVHVLIEH